MSRLHLTMKMLILGLMMLPCLTSATFAGAPAPAAPSNTSSRNVQKLPDDKSFQLKSKTSGITISGYVDTSIIMKSGNGGMSMRGR